MCVCVCLCKQKPLLPFSLTLIHFVLSKCPYIVATIT